MTTRRAVLVDIITAIIGVTIGLVIGVTIGLAISEGLRHGPLWQVGVLAGAVVYFAWRVWRP